MGDEWRVVVDWESAGEQRKHRKEVAQQESEDAKNGKQKDADGSKEKEKER